MILGLVLSMPLWSVAQSLSEAVLFSQQEVIGSARVAGVNGAFGAMGGDYSSVMINPAGLGEYKKGEFMFTPSMTSHDAVGFFLEDPSSRVSRDKSVMGIDNVGLVFSSAPRSDNWWNSNFLVGYNKTTTFNRNYSLFGTTLGSITERFIEVANTNSLNQLDGFEGGLAYDAGAIFDSDGDTYYEDDFFDDESTEKQQVVNQTGSLSEISLAWGGNFRNQWNFGISLGIPLLFYDETKAYRQTFQKGEFSNRLDFNEHNEVSGSGLNMKLGVVFKPINMIRLGVAYHTPTLMTLSTDYYNTMEYRYQAVGESFSGSANSPAGYFKYNLTLPGKLIASIGSIVKVGDVAGFINLDYERIDYTESNFDLTSSSTNPSEALFSDELNGEIENRLTAANNLRIGGELAFNFLRVRGGYGVNHSAYNGEDKLGKNWSIGLGYSGNRYFIDVAFRNMTYAEGYNPYYLLASERDPVANVENTKQRLSVTLGVRI